MFENEHTQHPNGGYLITGPLGSGKTSTLEAIIDTMRQRGEVTDRFTIEGPVEYFPKQ